MHRGSQSVELSIQMGLLAVLATSPNSFRGADTLGSSAVACTAASLRGSIELCREDLSNVTSDTESKRPKLIEKLDICTFFHESNVTVWSDSRTTYSFNISQYGCGFNRSAFSEIYGNLSAEM